MTDASTALIGDFCKTGSGGTPSRSYAARYYEDGTIPWVKSGELREGLITSTDERITPAALKESSVKLVPSGAILLAMYGATVGRLAILGIEATTNQAVCHIVPEPRVADTRYVYHAIASQVPAIIAMGVGGAQPNISQALIRDLCVPLPPLPEQRRIAAILDQADALRAKRREALAQLDSLTQSIFIEMFGDPVVGAQTAPLCPLDSLLEEPFQNGAYFQREAYREEDGVEMVHMSDAFGGTIVRGKLRRVSCSASEIEKYSLNTDDILIARRSITYEGAAQPCMVPRSSAPLIFESSFIRVRPDKSRITPLYLFHYLNNERVRQRYVRPYVTQSTISGINQSNLAQVLVVQPPLDQQQLFGDRIAVVDQIKQTFRVSLLQLDTLFASLQHRAFRGEL